MTEEEDFAFDDFSDGLGIDVTDPRVTSFELMGGDHSPVILPPVSPRDFNIFATGARGGTRFQPREVIRYLEACRIVFSNGVWRRFDGRIYAPMTREAVANMVILAIDDCGMGYMPTKSEIENIMRFGEAILTPERTVGWWSDPEASIPYDLWEGGALYAFDNGIYNSETDKILPFTPNVFLTHYVHARWYPALDTASIEGVIDGIIPDKDTQKFFFEMVGYILYSRDMLPPALFVLYGPGETGKSALHNAICAVLGWDSVSQLGLEQLTQRFMTAELDGKLLNVSGESGASLGPFNRVNGELIKKLSDGQIIKVEQKHGHPYDMKNTAKLLFVSNTVPDFGDTSSGFYRRVHIIPCRVRQKTSDMIYDKMTDDNSRTWLAVKAFYAYQDFVARGLKFSDSAGMGEELTAFKSQDAFYDFLQTAFPDIADTSKYGDKIVEDSELRYTVNLYALYHDFCVSSRAQPMSRKKFVERIRNEFSLVTRKKWYEGTTRDVYEKPKKS